jgi:diguanylate cyclase (GGDEF)-like protein/putative nucleotidyltransferase with HDIG domain
MRTEADLATETNERWAWLARSLSELGGEVDREQLVRRATDLAAELADGWTFVVAERRDNGSRLVSPGPLDPELLEQFRMWSRGLLTTDDGDEVALSPSPASPQSYAVVVPTGSRDELALMGISRPGAIARPALEEMLEAVGRHLGGAWATARRLADESALASRDPLTGLLNHRRFHDALEKQLDLCRSRSGSAQTSVIVFDLDDFKQVNDVQGHAAGDRVLRAVASALATASRADDTAFRIGGDEFALILPGAGPAAAQRVAKRVRRVVADLGYAVGPAFGVANWPDDGPTKKRMLDRADERLYTNKGIHRAGADVGADMALVRARDRLALASRLATKLAPLRDEEEIGRIAVDELHGTFHYYLAVVQKLCAGDFLRVVAAAGPLSNHPDFLAADQPLSMGVNGRVARTGEAAIVGDTRLDPDYLRRDPSNDPGAEISLPIWVDGRIWGVLNIEELSTYAFDDDDVLLAETIAAQVGAAVHRAELFSETESALVTTLATLCDALEAKDRYTASHAKDVAVLAERVGARLGLDDRALRDVRYAALLHDIGKIGVRSEIILKPGPLTSAEFEEMKAHVDIGADLLERIDVLAQVAPLVRAAHERSDGRGYPAGLHGEQIPLGARIISACDAYNAMTTERPYRMPMDALAALDELRLGAGSQFDADVIAALEIELMIGDRA